MPITAKTMKDAVRTVHFKFLGEDVKITYRLGAMNSELSDWVKQKGDDVGALRDMCEKVFTAWDVLDDDGNPIPTTRVAIEEFNLPTPFLNACFDAVYQDTTPGELKKLTYGARSLVTAI